MVNIAFAGDIYAIRTEASNNNSVISVPNNSLDNSIGLEQLPYSRDLGQRFLIFPIGSGSSVIANVGSGKVIDVRGGSPNSGTRIQQFEFNGTISQEFILENTLSPQTIQTSLGRNMVIDVQGGSPADGTAIQQFETNGTRAQKFTLEAVGSYELPIIPEIEEVALPTLTSRSLPTELVTRTFTTGAALVPYFIVSDPDHNMVSRAQNIPYYLLIRESFYTLDPRFFVANNTSETQMTLSVMETTGFSQETTQSFERTVGISVTAEVSGGIGPVMASLSTTVTAELGFSSSESLSEFQESTFSQQYAVAPNTSLGVRFLTDRFTLKRPDNSVVNSYELTRDSVALTQYPLNGTILTARNALGVSP